MGFDSAARPTSSQLSVLCFNIRADTGVGRVLDRSNAWPFRKWRVLNLIRDSTCDIIGLQECVRRQWEYLYGALRSDYDAYRAGSNGGLKGEILPILWKRERYVLQRCGTFWISEGYAPLQKLPGAKRPRICSWVSLRDRRTGEALTIYNAHFDHRHGTVGRRILKSSAELVLDYIRDRGLTRSILLGDLNCRDSSPAWAVLATELVDSYAAALGVNGFEARPGTYHVWGERGMFHIDFVFCTPDIGVERYELLRGHGGPGKGWPSDHWPVRVLFK